MSNKPASRLKSRKRKAAWRRSKIEVMKRKRIPPTRAQRVRDWGEAFSAWAPFLESVMPNVGAVLALFIGTYLVR